MDIQGLLVGKKSPLIVLSLAGSCCYHVFLAITYGGFPLDYYPDELQLLSTGLYLVNAGEKVFPQIVLSDKTLMVPLFEGILYKVLGFPNFLYFLCIWDILTVVLLLLFSYRLGSLYFDDEWTGITAAILFAFNWHIGWYAHRLMGDVMMTAFEFAALTFYLEYCKSKRTRSLLLCGLTSALALWTKESALYLLPFLFVSLFIEKRSQVKWRWMATGFLLGFCPFAVVSLLRYGNPIMPFMLRLQQSTMWGEIKFNFFYIQALPASIGVFTVLLYIDSFIRLLKQKKLVLPLASLLSLSVYLFLHPTGTRDLYLVHYTPFFILASAPSLRKTVASCLERYGLKGILVMAVVVLFTNVSPRSEDPYTWISLHQRMMQIDKYGSIGKLIAPG